MSEFVASLEVADEFFDGYKLRLPDSAVLADYAIDHLKRLVGSKMLVDFKRGHYNEISE